MSLNQPLLLSSALVHQVLLNPATYPSKQVTFAEHLSEEPRLPSTWNRDMGHPISGMVRCGLTRSVKANLKIC